ncbi:MAG: right-handed parallel beta-helix repeat-containing protein, partial [Thermoplasmata archaeon]
MRRIRTVLVALVILTGALFIADMGFDMMTTRASAETIYVGGSGPGNYSTIQAGINDADPGDTIYVYAGTYNEGLYIDKTLTLLGEDKYTTIINATGKIYGILIDNADYVNISGFSVIGANFYNIRLYPGNHSHIYDNILKNSGSIALGVNPGHENLIENNFIVDNPRGVLISDHSSANILKSNIINSSGGRAITIGDGATENLISHNTISGYDTGIYNKESENNRIEYNQISDGANGVKIFDQSSGLLLNNIISNNEIGVKVFDHASAMVVNCTIQNSNLYDLTVGDTFNPTADVTLINTSFNDNKVDIMDDTSGLTVQWYLDVNVVDKSDEPVSGIDIRIRDNPNGDFDEVFTTNSGGRVDLVTLTQYLQNRTSKVSYTPHNITAYNTTSLGYASPEVFMDTSKEITIKVFSDMDGDG